MDKEMFEKWENQSKALGLKNLRISMDFNPDHTLLEVVERGQREIVFEDERYTEIDITNDDYAFGQFTVPLDTTYGEAAQRIDAILQSTGDERVLFLELMKEVDMDAVTETIFFRVFLGS